SYTVTITPTSFKRAAEARKTPGKAKGKGKSKSKGKGKEESPAAEEPTIEEPTHTQDGEHPGKGKEESTPGKGKSQSEDNASTMIVHVIPAGSEDLHKLTTVSETAEGTSTSSSNSSMAITAAGTA